MFRPDAYGARAAALYTAAVLTGVCQGIFTLSDNAYHPGQ